MRQDSIGKFIARMRKEKGLTQKELADRLGVNYRSVSRWENGYCMPDLSLLQDLAAELDISVQELLDGTQSDSAHLKETSTNTAQSKNTPISDKSLLFLGEHRQVIKKIYQPALHAIEQTLHTDESIQFVAAGEDLLHNELPIMWHTLLAVTNERIILSGERQKGMLFTRNATESFPFPEIKLVSLTNSGFQFALLLQLKKQKKAHANPETVELKLIIKDRATAKEIQKYLSQKIS